MKKFLAVVLMFCILGIVFIKIFPNLGPEYTRDMKDAQIFIDQENDVLYAWFSDGCGAGMTIMLGDDESVKIKDKSSKVYGSGRYISDTTIFVDFEERVMYTWYSNGEGAGMSYMLTQNSLPKTYNKYRSIYKNVRDLLEDAIILVDKDTKVMYAFYQEGDAAGMSVMLTANGSPKLYNKEKSTYTNVVYISKDMIFVDKETKNMFVWYQNGEAVDIAMMLNQDGTPKKCEKKIYKSIELKTKKFMDYEDNMEYLWFKGKFGGGMELRNATPKIKSE